MPLPISPEKPLFSKVFNKTGPFKWFIIASKFSAPNTRYALQKQFSRAWVCEVHNSDELYQDDGRKLMAESLRDQHPDIVKITRKWNRWQHHVDYSGFKKNKLILDPNYKPAEGVNDYGMKLAVYDDDPCPARETAVK